MRWAAVVWLAMAGGLWGQTATFDAVARQAAAAREGNDGARAMQLYRQAVELKPEWQEGWWFLGTLAYDADDYATGRDAFRRLTHLDPKAAAGFGFLGLCEFETGEYERALADIERGLAPGVGDDRMANVLRFHESMLLTREGRFDRAVEIYRGVAASAPGNEEVLAGLGLAASHVAKLPREMQGETVFQGIGEAVYETLAGDAGRAAAQYASLLERFPNSAELHYVHGMFVLGNDPETAKVEMKRALELRPGDGPAAVMLAWLFLQEGDAPGALPYAAQGMAARPAEPLARLVYGRALVGSGSCEQGIELLEQAAKADGANLEVHLALATAYSKAGRKADALRERRRSLEMVEEKSAASGR